MAATISAAAIALIAAAVDGLLMVASVRKARRPVLEEGREILEALPCRKLGVIVTGEKIDDSHYAGYASQLRDCRPSVTTSNAENAATSVGEPLGSRLPRMEDLLRHR